MSAPITREAMEKRIRKIVEGQVRSYMNDHPEKFAENTLCPRVRRSVETSIAKRVVPDILTVCGACGQDDGGVGVICAAAGECGFCTALPEKVPAGVGSTAPAGRSRSKSLLFPWWVPRP